MEKQEAAFKGGKKQRRNAKRTSKDAHKVLSTQELWSKTTKKFTLGTCWAHWIFSRHKTQGWAVLEGCREAVMGNRDQHHWDVGGCRTQNPP